MIKKTYTFLGIAVVLIAIAFWHKNYIEKNVPENPISKPIPIKPVITISEPYLNLCTKKQRGVGFCAQIYAPVCAEVQIQCIKAPCYPIKETFSSSCEACKNQLVSSYTTGECK